MIIDNFWHRYHGQLGVANWTNGDSDYLGSFGFDQPVNERAPPLPVCVGLTADNHLYHPVQDSVPSFADYRLADIVINGADDDYLQSLQRGKAPQVEKPFPKLPALLWHRIAFEDGVQGRDMLRCSANASEECPSHYASLTPEGRALFCEKKHLYSPDLEPRVTCDGGTRLPATAYPYCNRETAPSAIVSVDCLISESGYALDDISWNLLSLSAGGRALQYNTHGRWQLPRGVPVFDYDELGCVGVAVYPSAPGHFFNEILPRLLHMDATLPAHIPMLWPDGKIPASILAAFRDAGILSRTREFVPTRPPRLHRARRMYVFTSDYDPGHTPLIIRLGHANLRAAIRRCVAARAPATHDGIVFLTRGADGKARSVANQGELLAALAKAFPNKTVDAFEPTGDLPFLDVAARVYPARVVIGPHGANLNNVVGARPGTTMVEFGYAGGMGMPSDFFCLGRNLGFRYWLSPSLEGEYGSPMRANIPDVISIIRLAYAA